jgi:hypothetical protein
MKISLSLFLGILAIGCVNHCLSADQARLQVENLPDPSGLSPSSRLYLATLRNDTKSDILLNAVQMPGGYVGSGTFFNCSLEQWDGSKKQWKVVRRESLAGFAKNNQKPISVKPGGQQEVCRNLLPHDAGSLGSCMRFHLKKTWDQGAATFFSEPFVVWESSPSNSCPSEVKNPK